MTGASTLELGQDRGPSIRLLYDGVSEEQQYESWGRIEGPSIRLLYDVVSEEQQQESWGKIEWPS